jgi:tetratricopeptide (TPR) repeat protein
MAKRVGNDRVLHLALWSLANTVMDPRQYDVRLRAALEAVELASRTGDRFAPLYAAAVVFDVRLEAGDIREIEAAFHRWQEVDRDVLWLWDPFFLQVVSAMLAFLRGRLPEAEKLTVAAHEIGRGLYGIDPDGPYSLQMFTIRREQGRLREIAPALQTMVELGVAQETWRPGLAALWADLGLVTEAQAELAALIPRAQVLIPRDSRLAISLSYLSDAAVLAGDQERAEVLYRELLPYAALCITGLRIACYGPASRYLGMLATTLGRFDDAQEHFEDALLRCDRLESPVWTAHTQYHFARMLLTRRRPADVAQAELLARAARQTAAAIGMRSLQDRVGRLLESGLGVGHNDD